MNRLSFDVPMVLLLVTSQISFGSDRTLPPIRVGVLHSLSGTMAISERSLVDAARMAIDEINQEVVCWDVGWRRSSKTENRTGRLSLARRKS